MQPLRRLSQLTPGKVGVPLILALCTGTFPIVAHDDHSAGPPIRRCGTPSPTKEDLARSSRRLQKFASASELLADTPQKIEIPIYYHVIHDGDNGKVDRPALDAQTDTLNAAFAPYGFSFETRGVDYTDDAAWFVLEANSAAEEAAKKALVKTPTTALNLYTAAMQDDLGYATFPWWLKDSKRMDGVVVRHDTLPGSSDRKYNLGYTAVHEVGHWLGLFHTFQGYDPNLGTGGCNEGDRVDDTPFEDRPYWGPDVGDDCPGPGRDTCPNIPGLDPIDNFMDYSVDRCMLGFTLGQQQRMLSSVQGYRKKLLTQPDLLRILKDIKKQVDR